MNICIGGPWNGCKLLGESHGDTFRIKDEYSQKMIKYKKKIIKIKNELHVFWVLDKLNKIEVSIRINDYLREYFISAEIDLIGDE